MKSEEKSENYDRKIYVGSTIFFLALCVLIVKAFHSVPFIRGFMGDMMVMMSIYSFCKSVFDFPSFCLSVFVLTVSFVVETAQYLRSIGIFRWNETETSRLTVGSVFDPWDLIAYLCGAAAIYFLDRTILKRASKRSVTTDPSKRK
ncbi:DUF2809 domain-containing protein [Leptospira ellisii]|uniref:DUF2809 domain-containing protein n=1 Tax=Leptospira ellisii TaxID=2023197 RepID=A0A2N0B908_9LEPT|nr:DUF2809 domain-containing protein [Leptospira ellisii]MDV6236185.1 DUF2809 domain-containing protein [Leptospira ellisii]PJZ93037.1 hypothetical protein CH379_10010 [Leptospira ellisii]PKA03439.1 hypothetical protein CH375_16980 [Leptospira ellisii]